MMAIATFFQEAIYFTVAFGVIFLLNLVGNSLVCVVVLRKKHLQNFTSMLLVNLAIGDLMVGIVCFLHILLGLIQEQLQDDYTLLCETLGVVLFINATSSIYTITALAIDRYFSIVKPIKQRAFVSKKLAARVIAVVWVASVLLSSPAAYFLTMANYSSFEKQFICWISLPQAVLPNAYKYALFLFLYLLPMCIITLSYFKVFRHLWVTKNKAHCSASRVLLASRVRLTKVLGSIIVILNICWLPFFVVELSVSFGWIREFDVLRSEVVALFALAQSCANPVVYSLQSGNFRRHIWRLSKR